MKATALSGSYLSTAKYNADPKKPISSPWVRGAIAGVHRLASAVSRVSFFVKWFYEICKFAERSGISGLLWPSWVFAYWRSRALGFLGLGFFIAAAQCCSNARTLSIG
jgi:hypothetical protein